MVAVPLCCAILLRTQVLSMTGLKAHYVATAVLDSELFPATFWCLSAVDLYAAVWLCRQVHAVHALEGNLAVVPLFYMEVFPVMSFVAVPFRAPVGLRAQKLPVYTPK